MKKILAIAFAAMMSLGTMAQTAQQVLDKTAAVIGNKKGATANFKLSSPKYGSASGTITIKGNKFNARTPQAIVWYNGKTQWTYIYRLLDSREEMLRIIGSRENDLFVSVGREKDRKSTRLNSSHP